MSFCSSTDTAQQEVPRNCDNHGRAAAKHHRAGGVPEEHPPLSKRRRRADEDEVKIDDGSDSDATVLVEDAYDPPYVGKLAKSRSPYYWHAQRKDREKEEQKGIERSVTLKAFYLWCKTQEFLHNRTHFEEMLQGIVASVRHAEARLAKREAPRSAWTLEDYGNDVELNVGVQRSLTREIERAMREGRSVDRVCCSPLVLSDTTARDYKTYEALDHCFVELLLLAAKKGPCPQPGGYSAVLTKMKLCIHPDFMVDICKDIGEPYTVKDAEEFATLRELQNKAAVTVNVVVSET